MVVDVFLSRDDMNDLFFEVMGFQDPVEMTQISWDDLADGVYFSLEISDRDAVKHEMPNLMAEA